MDVAELVKSAKDSWPKPLGLILALLAVAGFTSLLTAIFPQTVVVWIAAIVLLAVIAYWAFSRRLKRCPKGKFGFVIAISVDDDKTYKLFSRDFIHNLEKLLKTGTLSGTIWVYEVPQHHIEKAPSHEDAVRIKERTGAGFVLFGQVRTRKEGANKHYVDLSGMVAHSETTEENKRRLSIEFTELLPRRLIASEGAELPAFELTSSLSSLVAKYIAGIAAFLSGFVGYAERMYDDVLNLANSVVDKTEVVTKIIDRIPYRKAEISITKAATLYSRWRASRDESLLLEMNDILRESPVEAQSLPQWNTLVAIGLLASASDDFDKVEVLVKKTPRNDPVTHMNLAFFDVVRGDFKAASKHYRKANELGVTMETLEEVISFLEWFREFRPAFSANIDFALGYISLHLLADKILAEEFFVRFKSERGGRFSEENELIKKWMPDLELP